MATRPNKNTSNYGWALWHMKKAREEGDAEWALVHAQLAQSRATLTLVDETRQNIPTPTDWEG